MALIPHLPLKQIILILSTLGVISIVLILVFMDDPTKQTREKYQSTTHSKENKPKEPLNPSADGVVRSPTVYPDGAELPAAEITELPRRPGFSEEESLAHKQLPSQPQNLPPIPPVPETLLHPQFLTQKDRPPTTPEIRIAPQRYLFNNLSNEAVQAQPLKPITSQSPSIKKGQFAPQGEIIHLALMDSVISNRQEIDVAAAVWEPLYFNGKKLLNIGDKLLGRATPGKYRGRLEIRFYKIVLKDGKSIPIQAIAQDPDGSMGVKGRQVGSAALYAITPVLLDMASAFSNSFKNRVLVGSGPSAYGYATASGGIQDVPDLHNAAITGGQGGIQKIQTILAEEIEENRPYLVIPAGTRCRAFLTQLLDISIADYGK